MCAQQTQQPISTTMNVAIIDNYDSFTFNLVHLIASLGANVTVLKNDDFELVDLEHYDKIVLSPGPGLPSEAGKTMDVIRTYAETKPILGVCLGHQAIAQAYGCKLTHLSEVCWVVERESVSSPLEITAISCTGEVMGIRHQQLRLHGIQFHPESILTPNGRTIMNNWLHKG